MPVNYNVLIPAKIAENVRTVQYTATNVSAIIDKFTAMNTSAGTVTLSVYLGSGAPDLVVTKSLTAGQTYTFPEIVGHAISKGGVIGTTASLAGVVNIRSSGREIS